MSSFTIVLCAGPRDYRIYTKQVTASIREQLEAQFVALNNDEDVVSSRVWECNGFHSLEWTITRTKYFNQVLGLVRSIIGTESESETSLASEFWNADCTLDNIVQYEKTRADRLAELAAHKRKKLEGIKAKHPDIGPDNSLIKGLLRDELGYNTQRAEALQNVLDGSVDLGEKAVYQQVIDTQRFLTITREYVESGAMEQDAYDGMCSMSDTDLRRELSKMVRDDRIKLLNKLNSIKVEEPSAAVQYARIIKIHGELE
jgi:hypothetical protein